MPAQGRVDLLERERLQLRIDLGSARKRAADIKVAGQSARHRGILGPRQPPETQQAALAFGEFLRRETIFQCARDFLAERGLHLGLVLRRKDGTGRPLGMGFEVVPADRAANVVRQTFDFADALPKP